MPTIAQVAESYWMAALASPIGIGVHATDLPRAKTQLYNARSKLKDRFPDLLNFTILTSPENPAFELYVIRSRPASASPSASA